MALQRDLDEDRHEGAVREVLELEVGSEGPAVVRHPTGLGALPDGRDGQRRQQRLPHDRRIGVSLRGLGVGDDVDAPLAMRHAVGRRTWRTVNRAHPRQRVRCRRGRVERRVLDGVAHAADPVLPHGLHVHQRAAVAQRELAVVFVDQPELEVHVLRRRADVELDVLEDHVDGVTVEPQRVLHPLRIDRTGRRPFVDGDFL